MQLLTPSLGLIFWTLLAFLVVFFILAKFAWPAIINGLREREKTIADSLASAENIKAEMSKMKSENEALLVQAREERAGMLKDAKNTADKMVADAKEKAKAEYDKILADAQAAINQQKNAVLTDLKNQVGSLVIEVAEKVLRQELNDKTKQENYIKQLTDEVKLN
ncbi:F0F1 ATP synthase subunit B [Parafilimonas terrae]|uniref:ATP synthase subunit b n=1 Tax=Parafilimonas terrae TaxID=1465490 RepID=A0A1I5S053_9BACT|nr:F0F1 ATP synthase subunit B [Parafilimonas terrae]SFP64044.1 ATP synthase F0 subcomplex B subunit [Parafilimonas terrae]